MPQAPHLRKTERFEHYVAVRAGWEERYSNRLLGLRRPWHRGQAERASIQVRTGPVLDRNWHGFHLRTDQAAARGSGPRLSRWLAEAGPRRRLVGCGRLAA